MNLRLSTEAVVYRRMLWNNDGDGDGSEWFVIAAVALYFKALLRIHP
jgi:hypothetical protein